MVRRTVLLVSTRVASAGLASSNAYPDRVGDRLWLCSAARLDCDVSPRYGGVRRAIGHNFGKNAVSVTGPWTLLPLSVTKSVRPLPS